METNLKLKEKTVEYLGVLRRLGQNEISLSRPTVCALRNMHMERKKRAAQPAQKTSTPSPSSSTSKKNEKISLSRPKKSREPLLTKTGDPEKDLDTFKKIVLPCEKCPHLASTRKNVVFGVGTPRAEIMFVGEAPGADEDTQGEPFVGRAGQLLTKMIEAMGLTREDVYIANILKCRPDMPANSSGNRKPTSDEMATCLPHLEEQIQIIQPKVMVALGATAVEGLLGQKLAISKVRGVWQDFEGKPLMPTYHPAFLLRNQSIQQKRVVWEDLLKVMERAGLTITEKQRNFFLNSPQR